MAWQSLQSLTLTDSWQYTQAIASDYIRVRFSNPTAYGRGYLCQANDDSSDRILYDVQRLYPKAEAEVLHLPQPYCFSSRVIAARAKVFSPLQAWTIQFDYWDGPMPLSNPASIPPQTSSTATATTVTATITSTSLLAANANRKGATVWNNSTATLNLELGATASSTAYTAQLAPGGYYETPYGYTGAIAGIWSAANGSALVRELT